MVNEYQAVLIVGFGGPERTEDVLPFLENVTRGRNIPRERLLEVAEHYYHFGGVSPINTQVRELIAVLEPALRAAGVNLPVYWGNRNWHPMIEDAVTQMARDGVQAALGLVLAAYSSYSSCRQYREDIERGRAAAGESPPRIDKLRVFYNHPGFIEANADRVRDAISRLGDASPRIVFTAHSIPLSMANGCRYAEQLEETCRLIVERLGLPQDGWKLVYQSRSGRPEDPWLEPDVCDYLRTLPGQGVTHAVIHPVGFLSDHMEVLFDLDEEALGVCGELGLKAIRSASVGTHPAFVTMLVELIRERLGQVETKAAVGRYGASHDVCPVDCCPAPAPVRRPRA